MREDRIMPRMWMAIVQALSPPGPFRIRWIFTAAEYRD